MFVRFSAKNTSPSVKNRRQVLLFHGNFD